MGTSKEQGIRHWDLSLLRSRILAADSTAHLIPPFAYYQSIAEDIASDITNHFSMNVLEQEAEPFLCDLWDLLIGVSQDLSKSWRRSLVYLIIHELQQKNEGPITIWGVGSRFVRNQAGVDLDRRPNILFGTNSHYLGLACEMPG